MPITRKTALLGKLESSYGVDASPTTSDLIEISDFDITPNVEKVERNLFRPSLSPVASLPTKKYTELTFSVELKGAGVDANDNVILPKVAEVLQACGMKLESFDTDNDGDVDAYKLTPTSQNIPSMTFYAYLDGVLYKVLGARGNAQITLEANQVGKIQFTFNGLFVKPEDASFPNISCDSGLIPPIIKNVNLTMGGYAPILTSFEVNLNNTLTQRDDMNSSEGVRDIEITARNTSGSLNPDLMLASQYDVWDKFLNNEPQEIKATIGNQTGNIIEIRIPQAIINSTKLGDREGKRILNIDFTAVGCDDELEIWFK